MKKIFLIFVMLLIVYFSNTPNLKVSDPSTWVNQSSYKKVDIMMIFDFESEFYRPYKKEIYLEFVLHKIGHIVFYSLLTIALYLNFKKYSKRYMYILLFVFLFALSDEIHQLYVVGRSGRIMDVLLDFVASFITLNVVLLIKKIKKRIELT